MKRACLIVLLATTAPSTTLLAKEPPVRGMRPRADALAARIDAAAAPLIAGKQTAGFVIGVMQDGRVRLIRGFGSADLEHRVPVAERTVFRIGSITKQFTAAAVLLLAEEGKLSLDDTLAKYYPNFPRGGEVTLRQLLSHISGIHNYTSIEGFLPNESARRHSADELIAYIATAKPLYDFEPGAGWSYSNSGFFLLGAIVEKVSGQPLGQVMRTRLFDPLNMTDTRLDDPAEIVPDRAQGYDKAPGAPFGFTNTGYISVSVAAGAGAIRSTARDLLTWQAGLLGGKVLKPQSLALMLTPGRLKDGRLASAARAGAKPSDPPSDYGFGIAMGRQNGRRTIGHGGSINGFNAALTSYPDQRTAVVILTNTTGAAAAVGKAMTDAVFPPASVPGGRVR